MLHCQLFVLMSINLVLVIFELLVEGFYLTTVVSHFLLPLEHVCRFLSEWATINSQLEEPAGSCQIK